METILQMPALVLLPSTLNQFNCFYQAGPYLHLSSSLLLLYPSSLTSVPKEVILESSRRHAPSSSYQARLQLIPLVLTQLPPEDPSLHLVLYDRRKRDGARPSVQVLVPSREKRGSDTSQTKPSAARALPRVWLLCNITLGPNIVVITRLSLLKYVVVHPSGF